MKKSYLVWIQKRNLKALQYQSNAIEKAQGILTENGIVVLAASPSAGKTLMSIFMIEEYLKENPTHKVLVLAHGQKTLRKQFNDVCQELKPGFTFEKIKSCNEYTNCNAQVTIALPQTLDKCDYKKYDLVVVDEAHQFYFAKTVKRIIKKSKAKKQLLLTGTPSKFNLHKFNIVPVSLNTVYDAGMISDVYIEIASTSYNYGLKDYNTEHELKSDVWFKTSETNKTLDELVKKIVKRLRNIKGDVYTNLTPDWFATLKKLKKTMFVCRSQNQAIQVQKYFEKLGIKSALSISKTDTQSTEIERFKDENDVLILIVVGRGILGFNYEELVNVVDMTMGHNIDRIYQLFCRVARIHPEGYKKMFFKLAPDTLTDYFKHIMTATLMLSQDEFLMKFNGTNFDDMEIPYKRAKKNSPSNVGVQSKKKKRKYVPIDFGSLPVFQVFTNIFHKKDLTLSPYAMTTLKSVRAGFVERIMGYWTLKICKEDALNYTTRHEWNENSNGYANAAKNDWLDECCGHMEELKRPNGYWTLERCKTEAKNFKIRSDFKENFASAYRAARENGWLDECCAHMESPQVPSGYWTLERCKEDALKYKTKNDWSKGKPSGYTKALKSGWNDECCGHMTNRILWTKERCIENAQMFTNRNDWVKSKQNSYHSAKRNGWFKECTQHMDRILHPKGYWTKERCMEVSKECKTIKEFRTKHSNAYTLVLRHKWYEVIEHLKPARQRNGYWTKERCVEEAKKYKRRSYFKDGSKAAFGAARNNGWLDECHKHMNPRWKKDGQK